MLSEKHREDPDEVMNMIRRRILEKSAGEGTGGSSAGFRRDYSLFDFIFLDDEKFVSTVFRSFFKRDPAPDEALQYLVLLRNHRLNKLELISLLLQSQEGKAHGIVIQDLDRPYSDHPYFKDSSSFFPDLPVEIKREYDLFELLKFKDADFLAALYRIILNRDPDRSGVEYYLSSLQSGRLNRIEIIGRLRYSGEGRKRKVKIRGLFLPYLAERVRRVPYVGRIASILIGFLPLLNIPTRIARLERYLEKNYAELGGMSRYLEERMNLNTDRMLRIVSDLSGRIADNRDVLRTLDQWSSHKFPAPESQDLLSPFLQELRSRLQPDLCPPRPFLERVARELKKGKTVTTETPVFVIGVGDGRWLSYLESQKISARGLDTDLQQVENCLEKRLEVIHGNPITILKERRPASLGGATLFHHAYRMDFGELFLLLHELKRTLIPGAPVFLESQGLDSTEDLQGFLMDPGRKRPLPAPLVKFILEYLGFRSIRTVEFAGNEEVGPSFSAIVGSGS